MTTPIAILTSDTHLRDQTWLERRSLRGDAFYSFEQIITMSLDRGLPILAAGDLIDRRRNEAQIAEFVRQQLGRLPGREWFLYIQGQHELQYPRPWLSALHEHCLWLDVEHGIRRLDTPHAVVCGVDWRPAVKLEAALELVPSDCDILLMHQVCKDLMGMGAHELSVDQVPHAKLLAIGDFHVHRQIQARNAAGDLIHVLSPGSTSMQKIDEPVDKYVYVLYDDLDYESVRLRTRPAFRKVLQTPGDLDAFVLQFPLLLERAESDASEDELPDVLRTPIVDVTYADDIPDAYRRLTELVGDKAHLFLKLQRGVSVDGTRLRPSQDSGYDLVDYLVDWADPSDEPEVYGLLSRMLTCPDGAERQELLAARFEYGLE